ncbi:uncharacterized protein JN550_001452 [Neoarthrinium moseri]|uniref:uncharacterized protein n=1 Tax=Neoarthrinium moseri TaxID=1658444 RepID=UPI001FDDA604|nr:uncharacterized protein JN550_001452 [Neoarthrinium moseri]KAI1875956.1 hypothetical protein JN550_001452 [Neoarthrinium moseri]
MAAKFYVTAALVVLVYGIYRRLFPKPIPGIPYNAASAQRISGDKPGMMEAFQKHGEFSRYRTGLTNKLGFPLVQLFASPFMPPYLYLDDPRETEDILLRRNKEFDRSPIASIVIGTIMPHSTIVKKTTPHYKAQRKPWLDVMAPDFLQRAVAPSLYSAGLELLELWKAKQEKANGAEVDILHDFDTAALDAIWLAILGEKLGGMRDQINEINGDSKGKASTQDEDIASGIDMQNALDFMNKAALGWRTFKFPPLQLWLLKKGKEYQKYDGIKNKQIERIMRTSIAKYQAAIENGIEAPDNCAMDLVLRREVQAAHKAGVPLRDLTKDVELRDEVFLLLWAGHDTTSNTLSWWIKYMAHSQTVQSKLRSALRDAFPGIGLPSVNDLVDCDIPYLDAVIEEAMRLAGTATVTRQAIVDTEILGKKIPKGTNIVFNNIMKSRPVAVPEEVRSATSRAAYEKRGRPGIDGPAGDNLSDFVPERWLIKGQDGKVEFDAYAIPRLGFGDGPRGCFGRKLAMLELRIMITLTALSFNMLPLSSKRDNMEAVETMFRKPKACYARFEKL